MAPKLTPNPAYVAKLEAEKKEGLADRDDTTMDNLHKSLVNFLLYVMRDLCQIHGLATEQAESSSSKTPMQEKHKMTLCECEEIICDEIEEWSCNKDRAEYYDEPALLLHKKMWDVMWRCPPH